MTRSDFSRTLVLMRHAQAAGSGTTDSQRPLTDSGAADAGAAGRWLGGRGVKVDAALVSAAVRTRQTWEHLAHHAGYDVAAEFSEALYSAGPEKMLQLLSEVPAEAESVVVVAHNPTVAQVAYDLVGVDDDALTSVGFSPGTVVVFGTDDAWEDLRTATVLAVSEGSRPR